MSKQQTGTRKDHKFKVHCYSGHTYADHPKSFTLEGIEYQVDAIIKEWQEPGEKHFLVLNRGSDRKFELCYYGQQDKWALSEVK